MSEEVTALVSAQPVDIGHLRVEVLRASLNSQTRQTTQ